MRKPTRVKEGRRPTRAAGLLPLLAALLAPAATASAERPVGLAHWRFTAEQPGSPLRASADAEPPARGRLFDEPLASSLVVPAVAADGQRHFDPRHGAIRLTFQPEWASRLPYVFPGNLPGQGPGRLARLCQIGNWTDDASEVCLALAFDPAGTNLMVLTQNGRGGTRTNFAASFSRTRPQPMPGASSPPPHWYEVALNFSPERTELILDGALQKNPRNQMVRGIGVTGLPADARLAIGSAVDGCSAAGCWIDEVQVYSAPISPLELNTTRVGTALTARVETAPPAVTLRWTSGGPPRPVLVKRRLRGQDGWTELGSATGNSWRDADDALRAGVVYEYLVGEPNLIQVPLAAAPVEQRGHVLVLVDETVERTLREDLALFEQDLRGDGWIVRQHEAPRHDDDAWRRGPVNSRYSKDLEEMKSIIRREHADARGGLQAVILVGHVTVPYAGATAEDGHPEHQGAWPADAWFGDIDGEWSDRVIRTPDRIRNAVFRNVPGDGKWDANRFAKDIAPVGVEHGVEVAVGRIDFANLPAFRAQSEVELLRRYFDKNHRYRHGQLAFAPGVAAGGFFWTPFSSTGRGIYLNATSCASRLFAEGADAAFLADAFGDAVDSLWAMQGGYGGADALHNSGQANQVQGTARHDTAWLAANEHRLHSGFHLLMGSYFGDWNLAQNNFLRGCVALPEAGLAALWTHDQRWAFEPLGAGEPLGSMFVQTARGDASTRTTYIIGDPTLRFQVTAPPLNLVGERRRRDGIVLNWSPSMTAGATYAVYRLPQDDDAFPQRLNAAPLTEPDFLDPDPERGRQTYLVRALVPVTTGSGSFTNLSQAAFVEVR